MLTAIFCSCPAAAACLLLLFSQQSARPALQPDAPKNCSSCAGWNADLEPFKIFGNSYFVGTSGLGSVLVTSSEGHVLIDAGLPESAPLIDRHIRQLGFRTEDIKLILTSHAHFDHVGGVAAIQRFTSAKVAASGSTAEALRRGRPTTDDPQFLVPDNLFPRVLTVTTIRDGEAMHVGPLSLTPHFTRGHTPGSTTWTWQSCEGARCLAIVYADSLNAVSADEFRFTTSAKTVRAFQKSIATVESLPCDVLVTVHPSFADKLAAWKTNPARNPFIDAGACRAYAANARKVLNERLAKEREAKGKDRQP